MRHERESEWNELQRLRRASKAVAELFILSLLSAATEREACDSVQVLLPDWREAQLPVHVKTAIPEIHARREPYQL